MSGIWDVYHVGGIVGSRECLPARQCTRQWQARLKPMTNVTVSRDVVRYKPCKPPSQQKKLVDELVISREHSRGSLHAQAWHHNSPVVSAAAERSMEWDNITMICNTEPCRSLRCMLVPYSCRHLARVHRHSAVLVSIRARLPGV